MDNSLKQRLLGAAVLIALAIIFVPMFLSGSGPKPESETANLQAPASPDRRFQERALSLDLPPPGASPSATLPADGVVDSGQLATVDTATAPPLQAEPVVDVPAEPATARPAPSTPVETPVAAKPVPAPAPAATVATTPEPASLPGTAANGSWFVHLGDYGASKNANDLVATLKKAGYNAYTEDSRFGGKATLRVRVGPFADRAAAEATRLRIGQANVRAPATVVQNASDAKPAVAAVAPATAPAAVKPAATTPPAVAAPARAGGFAVQLGAFKTVDEANKLRDQLRGASFPGFVDKVVREGQTLWRVRVGPEAERSGAEATRTRIRERLKLDGDVVGNP